MPIETKEQLHAWTWADQVSTWRFWGLLISYVLIVSLVNAALTMSYSFLLEVSGLSTAQVSIVFTCRSIPIVFGFCFAWIAIKWRPILFLVFLAVLEMCGLILLFNGTAPILARCAGSVLIGLSIGAFSLAVPAIIAGGRHSAEAFLVAFGAVNTFGIIVGWFTTPVIVAIFKAWGMTKMVHIALAPVVIGAFILLTVRAELFTGQPPARGYALTPHKRDPISVALLFFLPFYILYWLYRVHGEVTTVAPSRTLLSPHGALLGSIFVPFLYPVALASLIEAMNGKCKELSRPRLHSAVTIFLWALFFPPVAGAMIQSGINALMTEQQNQPE